MTVDQISTQIVDAITKYSPTALEVAKSVERINALDWLLTDVAFIVVGIVVARIGWVLFQRIKGDDGYDLEAVQKFSCGTLVGCGLLESLIVLANLLSSPWLVVGLTNPGLALAHDAMQKVLGS